MDFVKKHYEKVLLGLVLLGLVVAIAFLPFKIASEKQALEDARQKRIPNVKPLSNLDLTLPEAALKRMAIPAVIDLTTTNKLFNPVPWQQAADKHLIKMVEQNIGPRAVAIIKTSPLFLTLTFDSVAEVGSEKKYLIGIQKDAAPNPSQRAKKTVTCSLNNKTDIIIVREAKPKP